MMIRVFADGPVFVEGWKTPFPAGALTARAEGDIVTIACREAPDPIVVARFDTIGPRDGIGFASVAACLAYLATEFGKRADARAVVETWIAGTVLGGHRIVRTDATGRVVTASSDDPIGIATAVGLTLSASTPGAPVEVLRLGPVVEPGFAFVPGPVFLGLDGTLTQDPPLTGVELRIGIASLPTRLDLAIGEPFIFAV